MSEPPLDSSDFVAVGQVLSAHGRDGGLNIRVLSDVPGRFDVGRILVVDGRSFDVANSRATGKNTRLLWLEGLSRRDQAMALRGHWLLVAAADVPEPDEGQYFHFQLLGMAVLTEEGELLGNISDILETGSNDVYVVLGTAGELLVPATSQVVRDVNVETRRMTVRLLEGLR